MSVLKNISFASKVAKSNIFGARYPLSVTFISTYRCNFTCEYCEVWRFKENEMSTKEVITMIDEFASLGMRRFSFNGGEPLLRDDIGDLISHCRSKGIFTTMFSNGSLVPRYVSKLRDLDILVISLDGPKEVHDRQRMEGTHGMVIEGIRAAKRAGLNVWTNTVITKDNLSHLCGLVEDAKELGVKMIFQPVLEYSHSSESSKIEGLASDSKEYQKLIANLKELKKKGAPIVHSLDYLDYIKVPVWAINKRKCWAGKLYCAVTPTGDVAPCYPVFKSGKWPNGLKMGFDKAFRSLGKFGCNGCYCALIESDFLYSFKVGAILNLMKSMEAV
ncbi:MAG: radical SAM protein [Deltaproteobacteria bacterium]|nr:radical SAM protein [Deltaproteobacteria bacterium]